MIVDNQKNQEKEIKLILQLLNAIKAKHTLSVQEAEEGKEAVFKRVEEKLGRRYNLTATRRTRLFRYWPVAASIAILILSSVIVSIGIINSRQVLTAQAPIVVEVPEGAITHLTLSDGTQVRARSSYIRSNSRRKYWVPVLVSRLMILIAKPC